MSSIQNHKKNAIGRNTYTEVITNDMWFDLWHQFWLLKRWPNAVCMVFIRVCIVTMTYFYSSAYWCLTTLPKRIWLVSPSSFCQSWDWHCQSANWQSFYWIISSKLLQGCFTFAVHMCKYWKGKHCSAKIIIIITGTVNVFLYITPIHASQCMKVKPCKCAKLRVWLVSECVQFLLAFWDQRVVKLPTSLLSWLVCALSYLSYLIWDFVSKIRLADHAGQS